MTDLVYAESQALWDLRRTLAWLRANESGARVGVYGISLGGYNAALLSGYRSEEHTSELQSLMRISYAVFCLKKKKRTKKETNIICNHNTRTETNKSNQPQTATNKKIE